MKWMDLLMPDSPGGFPGRFFDKIVDCPMAVWKNPRFSYHMVNCPHGDSTIFMDDFPGFSTIKICWIFQLARVRAVYPSHPEMILVGSQKFHAPRMKDGNPSGFAWLTEMPSAHGPKGRAMNVHTCSGDPSGTSFPTSWPSWSSQQ